MSEAFVVIDLETTGLEPANAYIVEWAAIVIRPPWFGAGGSDEYGGLVKPPVPIPPETSAVHHIVDADVAEAPIWMKECERLFNLLVEPGRIAVAHNAAFEQAFLIGGQQMPEIPGLRWICTYKAACRVWPDAPGLSNEVLRYYLGLGTGRQQQQAPHSALHDARVTAEILQELLRAGTSIDDMVKWAGEPAMIPTCPLGEWRGKKWVEVDDGFLMWIVRKIGDRPDVVFCAQAELNRREQERAAMARRSPVVTDAEEDDVQF